MARLYLTFKDNELTAAIDGIATTDTIGLEGVAEFFGWDGYSKTIVFYQNPRKPYHVVCPLDEFTFTVPHEVLTTDGPLAIGAFGVTEDGKRKTSTVAIVNITKGMFDEKAIESIEPTPTEYEQMLAFMNAYMQAERLVDSVAEAAEQATEIAKEAINDEKNVAIEEAKAEISAKSQAEKAEIETLGEGVIERAEGYANAAAVSSVEAANSVGRISSAEKRLSNIEQSITPSPFITDDSVAYSKAVPVNALPYAEVNEIGGMCAVKNGVLVSAPVTEVKSVGDNEVASLIIPEALRNLEGYGLGAGPVGNTIDFNTGKYTRRVGIVDLGSLVWDYSKWGEKNTFNTYDLDSLIKLGTSNVVCFVPFVSDTNIYYGTDDNSFCVNNTAIRGIFSGYTDKDVFKAAMSGVMLVYELAEPIVEDISDLLPLDNFIEVFEGGVVYAENEHKLDVPNKITYQIKEVT